MPAPVHSNRETDMETGWKFAALSLLAGIAPQASLAEAGQTDFVFSARAGYEYDSNVNVAEIDANTGEGDTALVMDIGVDGTLRPSGKLSLDFGYAYSGSRHRQFSHFDLAIHHLRGAVSYRIAGVDAGLSVDRFATRLDGDSFLDITRVSPSLSRMFGDRLYLRGAYVRAEKSYRERGERDAVDEGFRADAYFLLDGMQRYVAVALERASEDASSDTLDYHRLGTKLTYGHRLDAGSLPVDVKAHVRVESRDYRSLPDSAERPRQDDRRRVGLEIGLPLGDYFEVSGQADYADNASTLESAAYDEIVYTLTIGAEF